MANNYGFKDMRNPAELMLSPGRPLARAVINLGSLKLDLGAAIKVPGAISSAVQLTGAIRASLSGALQLKTLTQSLSTSLTTTLGAFDANRALMLSGSLVTPDNLFATHITGAIPGPQTFFQFSNLKPGQPIPASFTSMINERKAQLQALTARMSSSFSSMSMTGVNITENFNKTTYPLASEIDLPTIPRLAQGGSVAMADDILRDKTRFVVSGVPVASGKPSVWSRLLTAAQVKASPMLNPVVNQLFKDRKNQSTWSEPPTPYAAQYPYNKVQQTESGHVIELDDTPGAERVHIFHRSGSFVEFHPNGTVVYKNMKDGYLLTMADQFVKVSGKCNISVDGDTAIYSKGNVEVQSDADINFQAKGDFNVFAQNVNLRAKKTFKGDGTLIDLRYVKLPTMILPVLGGLAPMVNVAAIKADYPGSNITKVLAAMAKNPLDARMLPKVSLTSPVVPTLAENPLANPAIYGKKTAAAVAYRTRLFDTPEETNDFQLYTAHIDLQKTLKDIAGTDPRQLGGTLVSPASAPATTVEKPAVNYLNYDTFKGIFGYANSYMLGGTSYALRDVVDMALYPDITKPLTNSLTIGSGTSSFEDDSDDGSDDGSSTPGEWVVQPYDEIKNPEPQRGNEPAYITMMIHRAYAARAELPRDNQPENALAGYPDQPDPAYWLMRVLEKPGWGAYWWDRINQPDAFL